MKQLLAVLLTLAVSACATTEPYDFTAFKDVAPRSILVVPVVNRSLDVDASNYVLSTLSVPLAELGYYVFPVNTVKVVLEQEGLHEPEQIHRMEAPQLAALFGADAVLFVTIKRWDARYTVLSTSVTVEFDYMMASKDGRKIWAAERRQVYTPQRSQSGGLIGDIVTAAMTRAAPNYMPLTRQANRAVFVTGPTHLPPGPYANSGTDTAGVRKLFDILRALPEG